MMVITVSHNKYGKILTSLRQNMIHVLIYNVILMLYDAKNCWCSCLIDLNKLVVKKL